jgi:hypothetical protein
MDRLAFCRFSKRQIAPNVTCPQRWCRDALLAHLKTLPRMIGIDGGFSSIKRHVL